MEDQIKTEYDPAGRMISSRWSSNVDGSESIATWTYDGSGRLLRTTSRNRDGSPSEQVYFYDEKGRLLSIIEGSGDRTSFQYARPLPILITSLIIMACLIPFGTRNNRKKTGKEFKLCVNHSFIA